MYNIQSKAAATSINEEIATYGVSDVDNVHLLTAVLNVGSKSSKAELAEEILDKVDFSSLSDLTVKDWVAYGVSEQKALTLVSAFALAKRSLTTNRTSQQVMGSEQFARALMAEYGHLNQEHLVATYLDSQNRIIEQRTIFIGGVSRSVAEPREILHYACRNMATAIIVSHNHPAGSKEPSHNDTVFTKSLKNSCEALGVVLLDHIIVTRESYYSYREESDYLD
uniref:RadC family protein n=1 Tax=Streptococcus pluranimalium TaxID=82348 RepID=UPI003F68EBC6